MANNLRKYEQDETQRMREILNQMNTIHARMGGRDDRPERVALMQCMDILGKEIERSTEEWIHSQ